MVTKAGQQRGRTDAMDVYGLVRGEILACRIRPGTRLKIQDLCAQHDVSNGAVREALSRLASEGLVLFEPQKGYSAMPVSKQELLDLTEARIQIESLCIQLALKNRTVDWESAIVAAFYRLSKIPERSPGDNSQLNEQWSIAHSAFHHSLVAACPVMHLLRVRRHLFEQSERYRRFSVPLRRSDRDVEQEHLEIKDAVLAGDVGLSTGLIRDHLSRTTQILLDSGQLDEEESSRAFVLESAGAT
ncbi:GntR family transcriptional regulator [Bradyrhizobium sp. WSM3983]|uniref:GntR family transcriptional regulator n=1 Tax=Bradyrhizobium sp. WSM3983 TaxID=1038867 RepID=UPI000687611A|nr:FCD domain-containing protein [Bradyrhizobium sp. WSM3983]